MSYRKLLLLVLTFLLMSVNSYSAEFYRKQSGTVVLTGNTVTVDIEYVCREQSFLVFSSTVDDTDPGDFHAGGEITDETTLTFYKEQAAGSSITIKWQVLEFADGVTVQHGSTAPVGTNTNVGITAVDLSKAFVIHSGEQFGNTLGTDDGPTANLTTSTNLQLSVASGTHDVVYWQVIEYNDANVQKLTAALTGTSTTSTIPTPVDVNKTMVISSHTISGNMNSDDLPRTELTNSSTVTYTRVGSANTCNFVTYIVEFTDSTSVAHGTAAFGSGSTSEDVAISADLETSAVIAPSHLGKQGSNNFTTNDNVGYAWFTFDITSESNLRIERAIGTGTTADVPYQIVTWENTINTTFYSLTSGDWNNNNTWSYFSDGSSGAVPAGVWPTRNDNVVIRNGHTVTVNAVNDNQICGVSPDNLNQANIGTFVSSNVDMFYQTGDVIIDAGGTLDVSQRSMWGGFTYVNGTFNSSADVVNIGNVEVTSSATFNTSDDLILSGNSLTVLNNTTTSNDDLYIDHGDALLCGNGVMNVGNGDPDPEVQFLNGATEAQVCSYIGITCTSNCGVAPFTAPTSTGNFSLGYEGPGGVGNFNDNKLWLRADDLSQADGSAVTVWADASGNGLSADANTPITASNQPTFNENAVNSVLPSIGFDGGDLLNLGSADLDFIPRTDEFSFFISYNVGTGNTGTFLSKAQSTGSTRQYQFTTDGPNNYSAFMGGTYNPGTTGTATGSWKVGSNIIEADAAGYNSYLTGTADISAGGVGTSTLPGTDVLIGARRVNASTSTFGFPLTGEIAEIAMYNQSVNEAQRIIIENYLAAKYDVPMTSNDLYEMDDIGNGNYDFEVAGIGQATDGSFQKDSKGQGLVRMSLPRDIANDEYLMWGHDNDLISFVNTTDVDGTTIEARLERVWRVSENDASGNPVDVGTVRLTFDGRNLPASILGSDIRLLISRDDNLFIDNDVAPQAGSYNIDNQLITFSSVNFRDGDYFTLGTINNTRSPLPVELVSFEAQQKNASVRLNWQTQSETNNDFFLVERSLDLSNWISFDKVHSEGSEGAFYLAWDHKPERGFNYYRLKQYDIDGIFEYSQVAAVYFESPKNEDWIRVFPNPNNGQFHVCFLEPVQEQQISVFDEMGRRVFHQETSSSIGLEIGIPEAPAGIYILHIRSEHRSSVVQLIKY